MPLLKMWANRDFDLYLRGSDPQTEIKGQKLPISLQMVIKACKFGQICYSAWEIRW